MTILPLLLALLAPPPPPVPVWHGGVLTVTWEGGTLHAADGLRGVYAWQMSCSSSPCELPGVHGGAALAVLGPGGDSPVVVVGPAPVALPLVTR